MKQYIAPKHLRIVGKGWEIRHQLRKLTAANDRLQLDHFTKGLPPIKVKLGNYNSTTSRNN
ncbi:Z-ring formation inhibitor MciZ [Paenibacillus sp. GSMTC-2017]|uniref:Z-ring formation inhibitor MciZ n=1 Tax=Paenibacillus sp. GSMTC-2017 TaxID=2794350 RepID=UPI0018D8C12C|nr:Z-ring formation inhibitor MciZ [Paenibacillus sp. GSMTC-2017]